MNRDEITIGLPPKVTVRENAALGVEFVEEGDPSPLAYHPEDNDAIRKLVWQVWRKRHPEWIMRYGN